MPKPKIKKSVPVLAVESRGKPLAVITPGAEHDLLQRLWNFNAQLRETREVEKVLSPALRLGLEFFGVPQGCVVTLAPGRENAEIQFSKPADARWDPDLLAGFLRGRKVEIPADLMFSRIRRYERMWGAIVVRSPGTEFHWDSRQAFSAIGAAVTQLIERIDEQRTRQVRAKIDQKILEQIGPKDLTYQILHGIRTLIGYDHSSALLMCDEDRTCLEVVGEQIAWHKAKSQRIGLSLPLPKPCLELLAASAVYGFNRGDWSSTSPQRKQVRQAGADALACATGPDALAGAAGLYDEGHLDSDWHDWTQSQAAPLADLLDYNRDGLPLPISTAEGSMLCAPLVTRHGVLGVLKVAGVQPGAFGQHEVEVISQFLPQVAVALQNMRRTETLERRARAAERKQAMADLARGVAHDVNNALGSILPLVQQLREETDAGVLDVQTMAEDLEQIERSLQVCRRVFNGMLSFARNAGRNASEVYLHHEVECTLAVFQEGLAQRGIQVATEVPPTLPPLLVIQADVEQVLLNLIGNARDAMQDGGRLTLRAAQSGNWMELAIADTGCGIPAENLSKIEEPFFTTKPTGNGLGLSICRSIVSQMRGKLRIQSRVGEGTTVTVSLPLAVEAST